MKILALDTATKVCSVAVLEDDSVLIENTVYSDKNHSEIMLKLIDDTLKENALNIKDIDAFAISNGPGSFTGLRVSSATVRAFASVKNSDIYEVCTLDSLAYNSLNEYENATVISIIDARRKEVYYGIYELNSNNIKPICDYYCIKFIELMDVAKKYENVVFVGDAVEMYKDAILEAGFKTLKDENLNAKASSLRIGIKEENRRNFRSTKLFYFKKSQAERELEEKMKNNIK